MRNPVFHFYQQLLDGVPGDFGFWEFQERHTLPHATAGVKINKKTKKIELEHRENTERYYLDGNGEIINFDGFMRIWSKETAETLLRDINQLLEKSEKSELHNVIYKLIEDINYYIRKLAPLPIINVHPAFLNDLTEAKSELVHQCAFIAEKNDLDKKKFSVQTLSTMGLSRDEATPKLQWKGKNNVLLTLFYDLINGQDKGEKLLIDRHNIIKKFILDNFRDTDGNDFSESSINTIFSPSKSDKRAMIGDRIELGNVKPKVEKPD